MEKMTILKNKTQSSFTIISNAILRDKRLSLKDRGLMCTLIGLPDNWQFSIKGLSALVVDGCDSIKASIKRLEELGYLKKTTYHGKDGKFRTELEIRLDCQDEDDPGKVAENGSDEQNNHHGFTVTDSPLRENRDGSAVTVKPVQYNNDNLIQTSKKEKEKSIIHSEDEGKKDSSLGHLIISTKRRVEYDKLIGELSKEEIPYVDLMIEIIADGIEHSSDHGIKVAGVYLVGSPAITRLLHYEHDEILAVAKNMYASHVPQDKPRSYYITALDNQLKLNRPEVHADLVYRERFGAEEDG